MTTGRAVFIALAICFLAATLEGLCAGKNVKSYFAKLKFPPYSPPLWVWYIIGGVYYLIFFFVTYRILKHGLATALAKSTLILVIFMMVLNGLWNFLFFRAQNLFLSFVFSSAAPVFDLALFVCLLWLDTTAAWVLIPYLLYRAYGVWWGYGFWKYNRGF